MTLNLKTVVDKVVCGSVNNDDGKHTREDTRIVLTEYYRKKIAKSSTLD